MKRERLEPWFDRWRLTPDGAPFDSLGGRLAPVLFEGRPAMLKVSHASEEVRGAQLMRWWSGRGAARVLALEGEAVLLERAGGSRDLARMARSGRDDDATGILCAAAACLHAPRPEPAPQTLVPLTVWFAPLWPIAQARGGDFAKAAEIAESLLSAPSQQVVLHGDLHHGNVLDFGARGWLAIDPKGLIGDRGFDYANMLCNPDGEIATAPGRLERQATVVSQAAGLEPARLFAWLAAYTALSASWTVSGGGDATPALTVLRIALAQGAG